MKTDGCYMVHSYDPGDASGALYGTEDHTCQQIKKY